MAAYTVALGYAGSPACIVDADSPAAAAAFGWIFLAGEMRINPHFHKMKHHPPEWVRPWWRFWRPRDLSWCLLVYRGEEITRDALVGVAELD